MNTTALELNKIYDLAYNALKKHGCDDFNAESVATTVTHAERDGSVSHGLFRIPSVPSEPTNKLVKLYPADVFFALVPVLIISPFASTTVRPRTAVLMVPYLTAIVPDAEQAAIPPNEAFAPGSIGKKTPLSFRFSFSCSRDTFA